MHLYDSVLSGNCYKVRLILAQLGRSYERTEVDVTGGERPPDLRSRNVQGKVPLLELDDGRCLAESNAILWYLAEGTSLLPDDPYGRAQVLQWLFFEQNAHEPNIAVVRHVVAHLGDPESYRPVLDDKRKRGRAALEVMERHLTGRAYFVNERYSIADIALYAYTHVAHEGGFDLTPHRAVGAWLERVRRQPGHVPMSAGSAAAEEK